MGLEKTSQKGFSLVLWNVKAGEGGNAFRFAGSLDTNQNHEYYYLFYCKVTVIESCSGNFHRILLRFSSQLIYRHLFGKTVYNHFSFFLHLDIYSFSEKLLKHIQPLKFFLNAAFEFVCVTGVHSFCAFSVPSGIVHTGMNYRLEIGDVLCLVNLILDTASGPYSLP